MRPGQSAATHNQELGDDAIQFQSQPVIRPSGCSPEPASLRVATALLISAAVALLLIHAGAWGGMLAEGDLLPFLD